MTPEQIKLGQVLLAYFSQKQDWVTPNELEFIKFVLEQALIIFQPGSVDVTAPKVEVDLSGLQRHENMEA